MSDYIKIENLVKIYNDGKPNSVEALKGVSLTIEKGQAVAFMGVSGSGKSTLLHILGGMDKCTEGTYEYEGINISDMSINALASFRGKKIGFIFQQYGLLNTETVHTNLEMAIYFKGNKVRKNEAERKIFKVLNELGIVDLVDRKVKELSGGQKQRVAIARAIVKDADLIIADEPSGALDQKTAVEIMTILLDYIKKNNVTLIMATHDINMTRGFDRLIRFDDGCITEVPIESVLVEKPAEEKPAEVKAE